MARRSATAAGQLAALFVADHLTGAPGVGIDPEENGDQLDIFGAVAEAEAETAAALTLL